MQSASDYRSFAFLWAKIGNFLEKNVKKHCPTSYVLRSLGD